ncbi:hypothetical protein BDY19DRAFT_901810 [Irpex rosettiformis]|uniref:Uncharacterized protein n=1 Tax=Irpex rosettiformis TaxID=378272 RepID=A0ACB8UKN2_9APHY|nr:hypothetical protein BDY19DRAFT_901810 [Irpex rosettiformis]
MSARLHHLAVPSHRRTIHKHGPYLKPDYVHQRPETTYSYSPAVDPITNDEALRVDLICKEHHEDSQLHTVDFLTDPSNNNGHNFPDSHFSTAKSSLRTSRGEGHWWQLSARDQSSYARRNHPSSITQYSTYILPNSGLYLSLPGSVLVLVVVFTGAYSIPRQANFRSQEEPGKVRHGLLTPA